MPLFSFFAKIAKKVLIAKKSSDKRCNSLLTFHYKLIPERYANFRSNFAVVDFNLLISGIQQVICISGYFGKVQDAAFTQERERSFRKGE